MAEDLSPVAWPAARKPLVCRLPASCPLAVHVALRRSIGSIDILTFGGLLVACALC